MNAYFDDSTIAAVSTPPGIGGISVIRISGSNATQVLRRVFMPARAAQSLVSAGQSWASAEPPLASAEQPPAIAEYPLPPPRKLTYGFGVAGGQILDECMAVFLPAPATYTREDMAEIHCHGSAFAVSQVLSACMTAGTRPAQPGEFTKRAFLSGRLDLTQAEAVMDVIGAQARCASNQALTLLQGGLRRQVNEWLAQLVALRAEAEAILDFPEAELDENPALQEKVAVLADALTQALNQAHGAKLVRQGAKLVLAGQPNAGKSSLLNALLGHERAMVTPIAGTTRDTLEESLTMGGLQLRLVDTAGLRRAATDDLERMGMTRTQEQLKTADGVLWVVDAAAQMCEQALGQTVDQACGQTSGQTICGRPAPSGTENSRLESGPCPSPPEGCPGDVKSVPVEPDDPLAELASTCRDRKIPLCVVLAKQDLSPNWQSHAASLYDAFLPCEGGAPRVNGPSTDDDDAGAFPANRLTPTALPNPAEALRRHGFCVVSICAPRRDGLDTLEDVLQAMAMPQTNQSSLLSHARHEQAVRDARDALARALTAMQTLTPDAWCDDLSAAHEHLCTITGAAATPELLDAVFSQFCLGK